MKYLILLVFGAGVLAGSAYYLHDSGAGATGPHSPRSDPAQAGTAPAESGPDRALTTQHNPAPNIEEASKVQPVATTSVVRANLGMDSSAVVRSVDDLLSSQTPYDRKRATWKQLKEAGALDQAITELERRVTANNACAECAAVLGNAYLQKCGTSSDVREQGILAMQADKLFDAALSLDPANWEARFTKAVALSYWPTTMNKGEEVIQHFTTLIQQQETQPAQPQFADTYAWLGDQYQKAGRHDDARAVWERGVALFPNDPKLQNKLASSP